MRKYILLHWLFALLCLRASAQDIKPAKPDTLGFCCGITVDTMPNTRVESYPQSSCMLIDLITGSVGLTLDNFARLNGSSSFNSMPAFLKGELYRKDKKYKAYMFFSGTLVYKFTTYDGGKTYTLKISK